MNRLVLVMLPLLLAAEGCSVVLDPAEAQCETATDCEARGFAGAVCTNSICERQCEVTADCGARGLADTVCTNYVCVPAPPVDPVWGCLGHVVEPVPDPTKRVDFTVRLSFASDKTSVTTATVDVCDKLDIDCTGMSSTSTPKGLSPDSNGIVKMSVDQGFDGFVRVTGPEVKDSRIFVGRPIITPPTVKEVRLLRPNEYTFLINFAKEKEDPTKGTAILLAVDCAAVAVGGVRFESPNADAGSREFYLINQQPTTPPTATKTDVDGFGGFLNLPVGAAVARSLRASDSLLIGESSFHVLADTISYVQIAPTPK